MSNEKNAGLGERIKHIRIANKMTMEEFGHAVLEANKSLVSKWERGDVTPNNERLAKIAELGNISTQYLLTGNIVDSLSLEERKEILRERLKESFSDSDEKEKDLDDLKNRLEQMRVKVNSMPLILEEVFQSEFTVQINNKNLTPYQKEKAIKLLQLVFEEEK